MNKVVNINLNGLVFSIDETAYEQLRSYLEGLKKHFNGTEGATEIIADIEARIAELLQAKISDKYMVIQLADVTEIITLMGDPREIGGEEEPQPSATGYQQHYNPRGVKQLRRDPNHKTLGGVCAGLANYFGVDTMIPRMLFLIAFFAFGTGLLAYLIMWIVIPEATPSEANDLQPNVKRLFRNPDDKKVGGVCAGAAEYFAVDAVWIRLAFLIAFFVFGTGLLAYIILWMAIPEAKTSAEKLQMKGETIDVNNIEKVVRNTLGKSGEQIKKSAAAASQNIGQVGSTLTQILRTLFNLAGKLIGAAFLLISVFVIGTVVFLWNYSFSDILAKLDVTSYYSYFQWGFGLFAFSVAALIMLIGVKMMFHSRIKIRLVALLLITTMVIGLGLLVNFGLLYREGVANKEVVKVPVLSAVCPDTLYIKTTEVLDEDETEEIRINTNNGDNTFKMSYTKDLIKVFYNTHLSVKASKNDSLQLTVLKSARGETESSAHENASKINFAHTLAGNVLTIDRGVVLDVNAPFKFQQIFAKLRVPVGTIIIVDKTIMKMINASYEEDFDMGETFKMTAKGLKCMDCIDTVDDDEDVNIEWNMDDENGDMNIRIGKKEKETNTETEIIKDGDKTIKVEKREIGPVTITTETEKDAKEER
ncbi:MAG: PspC domain-containing protein [Bacteroidota bacterium]